MSPLLSSFRFSVWIGQFTVRHLSTSCSPALCFCLTGTSAIARRNIRQRHHPPPPPLVSKADINPHAIYSLIFLAGFIALGYQIIWYRMAAVMLQNSPYSFASILVFYLLGISLGSYYLSEIVLKRWKHSPFQLFLALNAGIAVSVFLITAGMYYLAWYTPFGKAIRSLIFLKLALFTTGFSLNTFRDIVIVVFSASLYFLVPLFLLFVPTLFMGASFPLITSVLAGNNKNHSLIVGNAYFIAIIGNTLGALVSAFILLPLMGTERVLLLFILFGCILALFINVPPFFNNREKRYTFVAICAILMAVLFPARKSIYELLYSKAQEQRPGSLMHVEEGLHGVAVAIQDGDYVYNYINGTPQGSRPNTSNQAISLLPLSLNPQPNSVLIIGYGVGETTDTAFIDSRIKKITLVELNGTAITNLRKIGFISRGLSVSKLHVVIDDARHYLRQTKDQYDVVIMDPMVPVAAYANNIHSSDFFELVKSHLSSKGVLSTKVFQSWDVLQVLPKTIATTFNYCNLYSNGVLIASQSPIYPDANIYAKLLTETKSSFQDELAFDKLLLLEDKAAILATAAKSPINTDMRPNIEYYLGYLFHQWWSAQ